MFSIEFVIPKNKVLSSNVMRKHIVTWSIGMPLRSMAAEKGLEYHPESVRHIAQERYDLILDERRQKKAKANRKKSLKKAGVTDTEIENILLEEFGNTATSERSNSVEVPFLIERTALVVNVRIPTGRAFDPPNYWPTIKYLEDGLTDASWWVDDNLHTIPFTAFTGGEKSDIPDSYIFTLTFIPLNEASDYALSELEVI